MFQIVKTFSPYQTPPGYPLGNFAYRGLDPLLLSRQAGRWIANTGRKYPPLRKLLTPPPSRGRPSETQESF